MPIINNKPRPERRGFEALVYVGGRSPVNVAAVFFIALSAGMLGGCQVAPITIDAAPQVTSFPPPVVNFPPPTITFPPEEISEEQPQLTDIASREFSLAKDQSIVGELAAITAYKGDTLPDIARHFDLGYNDIIIANPGIRPWTPKGGTRVLLPLRFILPDTPHQGIVLNLANMRMFYYPAKQPDILFTYPLGIGREGWNTPLGQTRIVSKTVHPAWTVPESIRREHAANGDPLPKVVPPGPDNPLGKYALLLGFRRYLIHGTNKPYGIGMQVSHGCVRLYPEDIEVLFKKVSVGTPVRIIHQPYLAAWDADMLYLEAHQPIKKWAGQKEARQNSLFKQLRQSAEEKGVEVDWEKVERILQRADGIPTPILAGSPDLPELLANAPEVQHPEQFYGQPLIPELTDNDWTVLAADFNNAQIAQQLAEMLSHQGPPIPARIIDNDGTYQVIAGPFKNQKEAELIAKRIKMDFDMDAKVIPPVVEAELQAESIDNE